MITLPYGEKTLTFSNGKKMSIPNKMRIMSHSEIVRTFTGKMTEEGKKDMLLPESEMYAVLAKCYATPSKNLACVDYYVAAGLEVINHFI